MGVQGISFGTDGWRALIGENFTVDRVQIVAQAFADWLKAEGRGESRVLIGFDGRFGGEMFSLAAGRVLVGNGFQVDVSGAATSTPAVSWEIPRKGYSAGLMITASHNPGAWSGVKVKPWFGGSPDETVIGPIVKLLGKTAPPLLGEAGAINRVDFNGDYVENVRHLVDLKSLRKLKGKVVFDPMGGAQVGNLAKVLRGLPLKVVEIHGKIDPLFHGLHSPEPVEKNLLELAAAVRREKAVLGLASDGDGDRLGLVSDLGKFMTPHLMFALLLLYMVRYRRQSGSVVKTVSGSFLIERIARAHNLPIIETPVGFKYICKLMREKDVLLGGEESGGFGFKGYIPERDGLYSGLMLLDLLARTGKKASQLAAEVSKEFGVSNYSRVDVRHSGAQEVLANLRKEPPAEVGGERVAKVNTQDGLKLSFADDSWLLFRASGTEPLLRVYSESPSAPKVRRLLDAGVALAGVGR